MGDAGEPRCLEQGDDGSRLAAASADKRVVPESAGAREQVGQNRAADPAAMLLVVDVNGKFGGVPVSGAGPEYLERSPTGDQAVGLRDNDRVGLRAVFQIGRASCRERV